jgi:hypothetical protein
MSADTPLPHEADTAWQAYLAMGESKEIYFGFLQSLDLKHDKNESPSIAENLKLEQLLAEHDTKVKAFNTAMSAIEDSSAHQLLIDKLTNSSA